MRVWGIRVPARATTHFFYNRKPKHTFGRCGRAATFGKSGSQKVFEGNLKEQFFWGAASGVEEILGGWGSGFRGTLRGAAEGLSFAFWAEP